MHFTYTTKQNNNVLRQGDVIRITEELATVLRTHHPYFTNEQYKYFIVTTQSCDLERRNGKSCNSAYITLAAVRSFDDFIDRISKKFAVSEAKGYKFIVKSRFSNLQQYIEQLYNNNNDDGYFFLNSEPELDFHEKMVAFLKVSFALKSDEHYDTCLAAKKLELADDFKSKLGWMVGFMYSRVGTVDWLSNSFMDADAFKGMIVNELSPRFIVGENQKIEVVKSKLLSSEIEVDDFDALQKLVDEVRIESNYEKAIKELNRIISSLPDTIDVSSRRILEAKILSSSTLKNLIK